jgi:hypothetical protein
LAYNSAKYSVFVAEVKINYLRSFAYRKQNTWSLARRLNMIIVNDYAFHQKTGLIGRVIGYGHQLVNDTYSLTLKVLVRESDREDKKYVVMEDEVSTWEPVK